ncbi:hypothetical protein L484_009867 [Morus notabilis]|uniref:Uncharacterized protein n=1 Tax=Morus notabilis TaxID=981085 RepID=W9RJA3_9ROSA|nr:hypothetical protein L484_009867 [Morus notabilis]
MMDCSFSLLFSLFPNTPSGDSQYQRVSPDCLPLSNGKKPNGVENAITSSSSSFEQQSKSFRFRSPSRTTTQDHHHSNHHQHTSTFDNNNNNNNNNHFHHESSLSPSPSPSPSHGGDILLQWGHKKRSRVSRTEIRALTDDSSSSSSAKQQQPQQALKPQRRVVGPTTAMPPPPPPPPPLLSSSSNGRARKDSSGSHPGRNLEDRSGVVNGSPSRNYAGNNRAASRSTAGGKRSPQPEKNERKNFSSGRSANDKPNGSSTPVRSNHNDSASLRTEQEGGATHANPAPKEEKVNVEMMEWPRIHIALSRKEKEDDFLVMKGTKLPQRPKKRAKNIDRALQYCFPGMWLSDLTRNRYEVREKKCVKKVTPALLLRL